MDFIFHDRNNYLLYFFSLYQEAFYNPENNSGYIAAKLKNINSKRIKLSEGPPLKKKSSNLNLEQTLKELPKADDLDFFEHCSVKEQLVQIKEKLQTTLSQRIALLEKPIDIYKQFPLFFFEPTLVRNFVFN